MLQTLEEFLLKEHSENGTDVNLIFLLNRLASAVKKVSAKVRCSSLEDGNGYLNTQNIHGEVQQKLDVIADNIFVDSLKNCHCSSFASEEQDSAIFFDENISNGNLYKVLVDPLDGSSNVSANISIGSIFGILKDTNIDNKSEESFHQSGSKLECAGYALYGSSTLLVLALNNKVTMFVFDPAVGEFFKTQENIKCPEFGKTYSVNEGNEYKWCWKAALQNLLKDFKSNGYSQRYVGSFVADAHRTLRDGGIFFYPSDEKNKNGKLRLLYELNPFAFIFKIAGGLAVDEYGNDILYIPPSSLHQKSSIFIGSRQNVEKCLDFLKS